jgi:hypothetical protein
MAKNIKSLQLLRNTSVLYADRAAALTALTGSTIPAGTQDGTPVLARYKGEDDKIYTLVGYYADSTKISGTTTGETNMTVFDFEGSAADVEELKARLGDGVTTANTATAQFAALRGNAQSQSGETSVEGAKRYADEKVRAALDALEATTVADENKIVSDVIQTDGQITATAKNVTEVKLAGLSATADTKIASTDTLGEALAKLQGQIDSMDKAAEAVNGQVVTTIAEADGKVTETKANVKDLQLGGYEKDTSATGAIASADTINTALSKLENKAAAITIANDDKSINVTSSTTGTNIDVNIKSGEHVLAKDGNAGLYTNIAISAVTGTELSGLGNNVREAYKLVGTDSTRLGEYIKIYKDSSLYSVYLGHIDDTIAGDPPVVSSGTGETALCFIYHKEDGTYDLVTVNVEEFLSESEFKDGLQVNNHEVSVKVDSSSEKVTTGANVTADVLTVSASGVKIANVQNAINYAVSTLDASVSGGTTAGTATSNHVQVVVDEVDGKLTAVTVNESNIADADDLAALSAKTVTEVASSNNSIAAASAATSDGTVKYDIITDASKIKMTGFTSTDALSGINATSSITEAFLEVDKVITENEEVISAALNDLEATKVENITVNGVEGTFNNKVASVTIDGADIKLDGYAKASSSGAVAPTDTVNQAIGKLEKGIEEAVAGGLQRVNSGSGVTVSEVANNQQTINVKLADANNITGVAENAIKYNSTDSGLYIDYLDCGTY